MLFRSELTSTLPNEPVLVEEPLTFPKSAILLLPSKTTALFTFAIPAEAPSSFAPTVFPAINAASPITIPKKLPELGGASVKVIVEPVTENAV